MDSGWCQMEDHHQPENEEYPNQPKAVVKPGLHLKRRCWQWRLRSRFSPQIEERFCLRIHLLGPGTCTPTVLLQFQSCVTCSRKRNISKTSDFLFYDNLVIALRHFYMHGIIIRLINIKKNCHDSRQRLIFMQF
jgi:hypothetical protein